jgi:ammonium transporter, Amt family
MSNLKKTLGLAAVAGFTALPALAQDAAIDTGDTAWMMMSTALVLFMILPGLALFYGGLVRSKNMLSVLMQCTLITAMVMVVWVLYGYSMAFGPSLSPYWGGLDKAFLFGVTASSVSGAIPEYVFSVFQMTFAAITPALIIGSFAERIKFSSLLVFVLLWVTFVYFPIAHMVWGGPTTLVDATGATVTEGGGLFFNMGAMDFAGGTVVHINAGIAALVGALMIGKRIGFGKDNMAPHSMTLTMVGASILWVGWFGFNAGSALAANGTAGLAMINTFVATAAAILSWSAVEGLLRGKASMLGAASGMVAGLVAITPACGFVGPLGAILLGAIVSPICYFFVTTVKVKLGYDDSLDVFGVHCVGGISGALLTAVFASEAFGGGGYGANAGSMGAQMIVQIEAVGTTIIWCGIGSFVFFKLIDLVMGLRVSTDAERQGLDLTSHGESAYHS